MKNLNSTCGNYVFTTSSDFKSDDDNSFDIPAWDGTLPDDLQDVNVFVILE